MDLITQITQDVFPTITIDNRAELDKYIDLSCTWMIEKIGESNIKIRQKTQEAALNMIRHGAIGPKIWMTHLLKGQLK